MKDNPRIVFLPKYMRQYKRVKRMLKRVEQGAEDVKQGAGNRIDLEDNLWAFFMNCWHLKDWIHNDETVDKKVCQKVRVDAEKSAYLWICADLAVYGKHCGVSNPEAGAKSFIYVQSFPPGVLDPEQDYDPLFDPAPDGTQHEWMVSINGGRHVQVEGRIDAVVLARKAVEDWELILTRHGLLEVVVEDGDA